jgi:hypothetical protein
METDCIPTTLDLFSKPLKDGGIDEVQNINILPLAGDTNSEAIEFVIPTEASSYVDLSNTRVYLRIKVGLSTGTDLKDIAKDKVELIKLWPHALFKQVDLYLGSKCVSTSSNLNPYRCFMETNLSYPSVVKEELLTATEHWGGAKAEPSKDEFEAIFPLHLDLSNQGKLILNNLPMKIRLLRNQDSFVLKKEEADTQNYTIKISRMSLWVRTIRPTADVLVHHAQTLAENNVQYNIDRVWMKSDTITSGQSDHIIHNLFLGDLPNRIIVGFVDSLAYNGKDTLDPFNFEHFNINHISLVHDGSQIPAVAYEPDFEKGLFRREYLGLLQTVLGDCLKQDNIGLSLDQYKTGNTFFGFVLPTVLEGGEGGLPPRQTGYINLRVKFAQALKKNITVIVYAELDNIIEVDAQRNIYTDFSG